jgi:hypothetical protein
MRSLSFQHLLGSRQAKPKQGDLCLHTYVDANTVTEAVVTAAINTTENSHLIKNKDGRCLGI